MVTNGYGKRLNIVGALNLEKIQAVTQEVDWITSYTILRVRQHLRIKEFVGVKKQIWGAMCIYLLVATMKKTAESAALNVATPVTQRLTCKT